MPYQLIMSSLDKRHPQKSSHLSSRLTAFVSFEKGPHAKNRNSQASGSSSDTVDGALDGFSNISMPTLVSSSARNVNGVSLESYIKAGHERGSDYGSLDSPMSATSSKSYFSNASYSLDQKVDHENNQKAIKKNFTHPISHTVSAFSSSISSDPSHSLSFSSQKEDFYHSGGSPRERMPNGPFSGNSHQPSHSVASSSCDSSASYTCSVESESSMATSPASLSSNMMSGLAKVPRYPNMDGKLQNGTVPKTDVIETHELDSNSLKSSMQGSEYDGKEHSFNQKPQAQRDTLQSGYQTSLASLQISASPENSHQTQNQVNPLYEFNRSIRTDSATQKDSTEYIGGEKSGINQLQPTKTVTLLETSNDLNASHSQVEESDMEDGDINESETLACPTSIISLSCENSISLSDGNSNHFFPKSVRSGGDNDEVIVPNEAGEVVFKLVHVINKGSNTTDSKGANGLKESNDYEKFKSPGVTNAQNTNKPSGLQKPTAENVQTPAPKTKKSSRGGGTAKSGQIVKINAPKTGPSATGKEEAVVYTLVAKSTEGSKGARSARGGGGIKLGSSGTGSDKPKKANTTLGGDKSLSKFFKLGKKSKKNDEKANEEASSSSAVEEAGNQDTVNDSSLEPSYSVKILEGVF